MTTVILPPTSSQEVEQHRDERRADAAIGSSSSITLGRISTALDSSTKPLLAAREVPAGWSALPASPNRSSSAHARSTGSGLARARPWPAERQRH